MVLRHIFLINCVEERSNNLLVEFNQSVPLLRAATLRNSLRYRSHLQLDLILYILLSYWKEQGIENLLYHEGNWLKGNVNRFRSLCIGDLLRDRQDGVGEVHVPALEWPILEYPKLEQTKLDRPVLEFSSHNDYSWGKSSFMKPNPKGPTLVWQILEQSFLETNTKITPPTPR